MSGGRSKLRFSDTLEPTKPPVLLLHGFLGDARDWDEITAEIGAEFRVIAVDLPGHGQSLGLPDVHYSIEGCAREIVDLVEDLRLAQVAVCGYSMGGRLALYLAVHYPARFSQVILESATAGIRSEQERKERHDQDHARAQELESSSLVTFLRAWYHQPLFSSVAKRPELLERIIEKREMGDRGELAKSLRLMGTGEMLPLWDSLPDLPMPVLCLAGELDPKFAALARQMAVAIPNSHAAIIADAGHSLHLEAPDVYIDRVRSFLKA